MSVARRPWRATENRNLDPAAEEVAAAVRLFVHSLGAMDPSRCGECGGDLDRGAALCTDVTDEGTRLVFMLVCALHWEDHGQDEPRQPSPKPSSVH